MFDLPKSTEIRKPIHKTVIYQKFATEMNSDNQKRFEEDISRIVITNEISEASVHIKATEKVPAMFVVQVELKKKAYNDRNIVLVSKLFGQKLLLALHYGNEYQLAIYETRLLKSDWKTEDDISLKISGLDLNSVWENIVTQVSGIEADNGNTLTEQIALDAEKAMIKKQIEELEQKARKEVQSKKKFEMVQRIKQYQERLESL